MFSFGRHKKKTALPTAEPVTSQARQEIALWRDMYQGRPPWVREGVKTLQLPAAIAAEVARLATLEFHSVIQGASEKRVEMLNELYLIVKRGLRRSMEYGTALGGMIFKPFMKANGGLGVDFVQADDFWVLAYEPSGKLTHVIFPEKQEHDGQLWTRLEAHRLTTQGCVITNTFIPETSAMARADLPPAWQALAPETILPGVDQLLFGYFRMPLANTVDTRSPLGVSVFSRAVGLIEQADRQYTRLLWEFESGERALYVDMDAFQKDFYGNPVLPDKRLYRTLDMGMLDKPMFEGWSPAFREESILNGLTSLLARIEDACGLARGTLCNVSYSNVRTATELKILQQRSYSTISDVQKALQMALDEFIGACDIWLTRLDLAPACSLSVTYTWDDSTVVDTDTELLRRAELARMGVIQPWELRAWYLGEDEVTAKQALENKTQDDNQGELFAGGS